jgi:(1->4)-alpha-D-glucan 1-alpha-D-glucosylmutase
VTSEGRITSTYRVQLGPDFDFDSLVGIVPYLAELGVSHVYCSSYLQAAPGSTHGYDVVDHTRVNDELGGEDGLGRLIDVLAAHGMGHILDVIPNHMAIGTRASKWWWDVLKNGPDSPFARFFDIDWNPPDQRLFGKILVPILGDHYGRVLESGDLKLLETDGELIVRYFDSEVPVAPGSLEQLPGADSVEHIASEPALLHILLENQHYRLAYWRTDLELNYRRFFDINELVALRMEEAEVFEHVHELAFRLVAAGRLDGLRIDHVDGLKNPGNYLDDLRARAPDTYIIVEKILGPDEELPDWPVQGTTGYDWLNLVNGLLIDREGEKPLTDLYTTFTGEIAELGVLTREKKLKVMDELLASDLERLVALLLEVCERHPRHRDYTRHDLRVAVRAVIAELEVYRTYVDADSRTVCSADAHTIEDAIAAANATYPELDPNLFDFLAGLLLVRYEGGPEAEFVMRWQQTTGPVMAKAVEDTLFYNHNRMIALNEVGGNPGAWGSAIGDFHADAGDRLKRWPRSMLSSSSHDTKRSEDVRSRLLLLSEIPDRWAAALKGWAAHNEIHKQSGLPDRNTEYHLYQTLVGAHPLGVDRAVTYMTKAANEAKRFTSWTAPDPEYDRILKEFVRAILSDDNFVTSLDEFVDGLIEPGRVNSLATLLLKLTCPGVPDVYQGTEVWDLSLVDPDNRRPVDYEARRSLLAAVKAATAEEVLAQTDAGAPKLFVLYRTLELRRRRPDAFDVDAAYKPLPVDGASERYVAFKRGDKLAVVVPRLVMRDAEAAHIELSDGTWRNAFTAEEHSGRVSVSDILASFPVALLEHGKQDV